MAKRACAAIGLGCLAALTPAPASASTDVFTNTRGDQVLTQRVLLQTTRPLYAATREPGTAFGPLAPVTESGGGFSVDAIVDDAGGAAALFTASDPSGAVAPTNTLATRAPGGSFSAAQGGFSGSDLIFTGNGRGDAVVAPRYAAPGEYRLRPAGGEFGPTEPLPAGGGMLGVAVDPDGSLHYFQQHFEPDNSHARIAEFVRAPGEESFTQTADVPGLSDVPQRQYAVAPGGRALVFATVRKIRLLDRAPGAHFGGPTAITVPEPYYSVHDVALAPSGAAALVFGRKNMYLAVRDPGGSFGEPRRIAPGIPYERETSIRARIDDRGDAVVAWRGTHGAVRAVYRPAAGAPGEPRTLVPGRPFAPTPHEPPGLAIAGDGRATLAWEESDAMTVRTLTRDFDAAGAGPPVEVGSVPSFVREGPPEDCRPPGGRVLRSSDEATVLGLNGDVYACLLARGTPVPLEDLPDYDDNESLQALSSAALEGPLLAYGLTYIGHGDYATFIAVKDLRDPYSGINRIADLVDIDHPAILATTRLKADGAVAWIHCLDRGYPHRDTVAKCRRVGGLTKHVIVWDAGSNKRRRVDSGRRIDPRTFKLRGSRLTWRKRGRAQHATLR